MYECIYCKQPFEDSKKRSYHQRYCKMSPDYERKRLAFQLAGKETSSKNKGKQWVPRIHYEFICEKCGKPFSKDLTLTQRNKLTRLFCSRKCANSHIQTEETKRKISQTLKKNVKVAIIKTCKNCGNPIGRKSTYCIKCFKKCMEYSKETREKLRIAGLKAANVNADKKRSRNEIDFYNKCCEKFKSVRHNVAVFNGWDADIIIDDFAIAVLWNGAWHYKQIKKKQSLPQIQTRDIIKIQEIKSCGYIPYVIKDMGRADKCKVDLEFDRLCEYIQTLGTNHTSVRKF